MLCFLPVLTRLYTPEEFSVLAIFSSLLGIIGAIACLRFEVAIPIAQEDSEAAHLLVLAMLSVGVVSALVAMLVFLAGDWIVELVRHPELAGSLWLLPFGTLLYGAYAAFQYRVTRSKEFKAISRTRIFQALATIGIQAGSGVAGAGALGLVLGHIASGGAGALTLGRTSIAHDLVNLRRVTSSSLIAVAAKFRAYPMYSATEALANSAALLLPLLLIASALPGEEVGQLSLAVKVLSAPMVLLGAATAQVFLSSAGAEHGDARLGEFVRETVCRMARFAVGPLVFVAVVAPDLFPLAFGPEWSRAGILTAWLVPGVFLQLLASPVSMSLHVIKAHRAALVLQISGAVLRIGGVFLATLYLAGLASEVFALTALVFYAVYLIVILDRVKVPVSSLFGFSIRAVGTCLVWLLLAIATIAAMNAYIPVIEP